MELSVKSRTKEQSNAKRIRREGGIPAIVYSQGKPGQEIVVDANEFKKILNQVESGTLSTKIFSLNSDGKKIRAILKDIQYCIITYNPIHLDFVELFDDVPVNINIPIQCLGVVDCAGVKLGGVLRQIIRHLKVRCLPKDIPAKFEIDVRDLGLNQSKKLEEIQLPHTVRPLINLREVAVVVAKR